MADNKYLRRDGYVEWRPDEDTVQQIKDRGAYVISRGVVCTACLVGDWPSTQLRQAQILCTDCAWLLREGADWLVQPKDADAKRYRFAQLEKLFAQAQQAGVEISYLDLGRGNTHETIEYGVLRSSGLVPDDLRSRIGRLVDWVDALIIDEPEGPFIRAALTSDVPDLIERLEDKRRHAVQHRARVELESARRTVLEATARVTAAIDRAREVGITVD